MRTHAITLFLHIGNFFYFYEKRLISAEIRHCVKGIIHFLGHFLVRYNSARIPSYIILMKGFREEVFLSSHPLMSRPEKAPPKRFKILKLKCYAC